MEKKTQTRVKKDYLITGRCFNVLHKIFSLLSSFLFEFIYLTLTLTRKKKKRKTFSKITNNANEKTYI